MKLSHSLSRLALAIVLAAFGVPNTHAHHGQDFLLLEDFALPAPGGGHLMGNFEWEKYPDRDEFGLAPSLMFGVLPRMALSVDVNFRDESDGLDYNSVQPAAHFQITSPGSDFPIKVGLSVGYQFVNDAFAGESPAEGHHGDEHADEHADDHGEEHGHHDHADEAEGDGHGHSHNSSVHNHDSNALTSRLIIEGDFGDTKALFNLISVVRDGGGASWGYAAGVRHKVIEQVALGIEALGDFESDGWHELVGGVYYEPVHSLTLKLGAGFGLTEETPDFTLRTGFIWRF